MMAISSNIRALVPLSLHRHPANPEIPHVGKALALVRLGRLDAAVAALEEKCTRRWACRSGRARPGGSQAGVLLNELILAHPRYAAMSRISASPNFTETGPATAVCAALAGVVHFGSCGVGRLGHRRAHHNFFFFSDQRASLLANKSQVHKVGGHRMSASFQLAGYPAKTWRHDAAGIVEELFRTTSPEYWDMLIDLRQELLHAGTGIRRLTCSSSAASRWKPSITFPFIACGISSRVACAGGPRRGHRARPYPAPEASVAGGHPPPHHARSL